MSSDLTATSRFLSYVLRHRPDAIGIQLDDGGWIAVDALLTAMAQHGRPVTRNTLARLVASTEKQRLEVRHGRIRATHGHSIPIDLDLDPAPPPARLYHGTVARFVDRIRVEGLHPKRRRYVHLSADARTAADVGRRRGEPVVLTIDAAGMYEHGHAFYRAANGIWLVDHVPPEWIAAN